MVRYFVLLREEKLGRFESGISRYRRVGEGREVWMGKERNDDENLSRMGVFRHPPRLLIDDEGVEVDVARFWALVRLCDLVRIVE